MQKKPQNNKGFSLVELLVATIILAIIAAPLLRSFVAAAGITARGQKIGNATLAAQNVAEAIEANRLVDLWDNPALAGASNADLFMNDVLVLNPDEYRDRQTTYELDLEGLQAGRGLFDCRVTLAANTAEFAAENAKPIVDYTEMDVVFAQDREGTDPDRDLEEMFERGTADLENPVRTSGWKREIQLTTDQDAAGNIAIRLRFHYECNYVFDGGSDVWGRDVDVISKSIRAEDGIPNVYIMYYPFYDAVKDDILIDNQGSIPFTLFLVKQEDPAYAGSIDDAELGYHAKVTQISPLYELDTDRRAKVYSNAGELLGTTTRNNLVTYEVSRHGAVRGDVLPFDGPSASHGDLTSSSPKNRLYQVTIELFDSGVGFGGAPVFTATSTKLQ